MSCLVRTRVVTRHFTCQVPTHICSEFNFLMSVRQLKGALDGVSENKPTRRRIASCLIATEGLVFSDIQRIQYSANKSHTACEEPQLVP